MSRQSTLPSQRNLTLTEELEKLEQSITLTLQEIDHNFSRAHRIVTTSILPIVEQYSEHSRAVWEGSKFWKQFFEASANVSLSSYEEGAGPGGDSEAEDGGEDTANGDQDGDDEIAYEEETLPSTMTPSQSTYTGSPSQADLETPQPKARSKAPIEDSLLSTPRNPPARSEAPQVAGFSSPYESLKRELRGSPPTQESDLPSTPRNPGPSLMKVPTTTGTTQRSARRRTPAQTPATSNHDVMLHRVLDKNYRLAATPLTTTRTGPRAANSALPRRTAHGPTETPTASTTKHKPQPTGKSHLFDDLDSSPAIPAPTLNADLFQSPDKPPRRRQPGVSVLSSANKIRTPRRPDNDGLSAGERLRRDAWDDDDDNDHKDYDDDEDTVGDLLQDMSPPKTVQFHVPQSRLLQTPAREASKRIVEDLLLSVAAGGGRGGGGGITAGDDSTGNLLDTPPPHRGNEGGGVGGGGGKGLALYEEDSPSIVKPSREALEDDTF